MNDTYVLRRLILRYSLAIADTLVVHVQMLLSFVPSIQKYQLIWLIDVRNSVKITAKENLTKQPELGYTDRLVTRFIRV